MSPEPRRGVARPAALWSRWLLPLLAVFLCSGVAVGYWLRPSDEAQLAQATEQLRQALEQERPEVFRQLLSNGFTVRNLGATRDELIEFLQQHAWKLFALQARVVTSELRHDRHKAWTRLELEVTHADQRGILKPFTVNYGFELEWRREAGGWKVIAAEKLWQKDK